MRTINLTSTVFVERNDFREVDDKSFFGLAPGKTVRLLFGYNVTCTGLKKDNEGNVVSLEATYDAESMGTKPPKGTLHWASTEFIKGEVRVYDKLFSVEIPGKRDGAAGEGGAAGEEDDEGGEVDWLSQLNPHSLVLHKGALLEPSIGEVADKPLEARYQLQRLGYFTIDKDSKADAPVLNRIVTLKESKDLKAIKKA